MAKLLLIKNNERPYEGFITLDSPVFPEDEARNAEFAQAQSAPRPGLPEEATDYDPNMIVVTGHTPKQIIASGGKLGRITIADNPAASGDAPWYEDSDFQEVTPNENHISDSAAKIGIDPDLLRAVIWMESTHGYYDRLKQPFDANASIRPMNINTDYWGDTWGSRGSLKDPARNIAAGARMLKAISMAMPNAPIASQATIYNRDRADKVSDYGARVQRIYEQKPWKNWKPREPGSYRSGDRG